MYTRVISGEAPTALELAEMVMRNGGLVAFPTDTVYGVGAPVGMPHSVERIFVAKGRPPEKAIPVLLADVGQLARVATDIPPLASRLAEAFWPGGLTVVLPKAPSLSPVITSGGPTVAVRVPDHPLALALIRRAGWPLATTSANRSGSPSPRTASEVEAQLAGWIELILDGGPVSGGVESTVLDLTGEQPVVLREGAIAVEELEKVVGRRLVHR